MSRTVTIHQPNFFPYSGFWNKMRRADVLVLMGGCQYEKNNFQNRFIHGDRWYTMSVNNATETIYQKRYINAQKDWQRIKSGHSNLKLGEFDACIDGSLFMTNMMVISKMRQLFGIKTEVTWDKDIHGVTGTDRLVEICKKEGATTYLSGPSGKKYLEMSKFEKAGIEVVFQSPDDFENKSAMTLLAHYLSRPKKTNNAKKGKRHVS
jgi:hypothetical protein